MSKHDDSLKCKKCGGDNDQRITAVEDYIPAEIETKCQACGHEDFWARGWFQSGFDDEVE